MYKDQYLQMRNELLSLWKILNDDSQSFLPKSQKVINQKLNIVNDLAVRIGGQVKIDSEELKKEVDRFLIGKLSKAEMERMFRNALKLEQDTREL